MCQIFSVKSAQGICLLTVVVTWEFFAFFLTF